MSRAFVRESDQDAAAEPLPERLISEHPNFVTSRGLKLIESQIRELEMSRQAAVTEDDAVTLARIASDLRYWKQRQATARVVEPPAAPDVVRFGVLVKLRLHDGTSRSFRLVGEDEADPAHELLSWVSPLARSLTGKAVGETVMLQGRDAEIVALES
jgi:transcription elongation GreA/GreB family factor